jgi:outer membrane protein
MGKTMLRTTLVLAGFIAALPSWSAAQTLEEALASVWRANPTIEAERARQRATKQQTPQAIAAALPQITAGANYEKSETTQTVGSAAFCGGLSTNCSVKLQTTTAQISGEQPVFTGFRNFNAIRAARARVKSGAAQLASVEQDVLARAAGVYFDVVRDMAVFDATANNVEVLARQKREADLRFEVGEVTKTDVAQADARLAAARAQLTTAQARLAISRANFVEVIGATPVALEKSPVLPATPETLDEAKAVAEAGAPAVLRARLSEEASRRNIAVAKGAFSPTISLVANYQYADEPSVFVLDSEQFAYGVRASAPIFLGGLNISRVREARALHDADLRRVEEAERRAEAAVTGAFAELSAARANIVSATAQVDANALALDGVRRESQLGVRTTLDVLDAEQELLEARVALADAERNARIATFNLLAAMGTLGPDAAPAE